MPVVYLAYLCLLTLDTLVDKLLYSVSTKFHIKLVDYFLCKQIENTKVQQCKPEQHTRQQILLN